MLLDDYQLRFIVPHPGVAGADDGLRPVGHLQLEQDVRDVVSNRLQAHEQLPGYLLVALALGNQGEDLLFALGELREDALLPRPWDGEEDQDALSHSGAEDRLAACYRSDGVHYPLAAGVFQEVALGSSAHRSENRIIVLEHSENQHTDTRTCRRISRVASMPFLPGIFISMRMT